MVEEAKCEYTKRQIAIRKLREEASLITHEIKKEIGSYCPIGRMSEMGIILGLKPKKGEVRSTPAGDIVFAKARTPSKETISEWKKKDEEAGKLLEKEARMVNFFICAPNTTIGNQRVLEIGDWLKNQNLLEPDEQEYLQKLKQFWISHSDADSGTIKPDGTIEPYYRKY